MADSPCPIYLMPLVPSSPRHSTAICPEALDAGLPFGSGRAEKQAKSLVQLARDPYTRTQQNGFPYAVTQWDPIEVTRMWKNRPRKISRAPLARLMGLIAAAQTSCLSKIIGPHRHRPLEFKAQPQRDFRSVLDCAWMAWHV